MVNYIKYHLNTCITVGFIIGKETYSDELVKESREHMLRVSHILEKAEQLDIRKLDASNTMLVIVDMVNGFVRSGNMASDRIDDIVNPILAIKNKCDEVGVNTVAFADCHTSSSVELKNYPSHCVLGTKEEEIIDELKEALVTTVINKNSTNGFLEDEFINLLDENKNICNFIVVGCCTDICVQNFAITLKMWFNKNDRISRVIVPMDAVETYDAPGHSALIKNIIALDTMMESGIEVVKNIV